MLRRKFIRSAGLGIGLLSLRSFNLFSSESSVSFFVHTHHRFSAKANELNLQVSVPSKLLMLSEEDYKEGIFYLVSKRHGLTGPDATTGAVPFCRGIRDSFPVLDNAVVLLCAYDYEEDSVFLSPYPEACMNKASEYLQSGKFKNVVLILA